MVFSYPVGCLFTFVVTFVALQKILNTIQSHVDVASCAIRVQLRTFFPMLQREVLSWWFIVATSVFNAVINPFELICTHFGRYGLNQVPLQVEIYFDSTIYWEGCLNLQCMLWTAFSTMKCSYPCRIIYGPSVLSVYMFVCLCCDFFVIMPLQYH